MTTSENNSHSVPGHERKDADVFSLLLIGLLLLFVCLLVFLTCWGLIHVFNLRENSREEAPRPMSPAQTKFPAPQLLETSGNDLETFRAQEERELHTYGWVDRSNGTVRIPIDRAMQLLLERGLPDVGTGMTPLQLMQQRPNETGTPAPVLSLKPEATP
jgi:hypothetical protein